MIFSLDLNTLQLMGTVILVVLSILFIMLWFRDRDLYSMPYWRIFALLSTIDAVMYYFPDVRHSDNFAEIFNYLVNLSYFALMLGCFDFSKIKINQYLIYGLLSLSFVAHIYCMMFGVEENYRRLITVSFNIIALSSSFYAIILLTKKKFLAEKLILMLLFSAHLCLYAIWFLNSERDSGGEVYLLISSVTFAHIVNILIIISLLILTLAKISLLNETEFQRNVNVKKALASAIQDNKVANKSKSIFLANMSHELRTPLNIILGFSDALKEGIAGDLTAHQNVIVDHINFGGQRLKVLINDLLNLSNIESGNLDLKLQKVPIRKVISDHLTFLVAVANKYNNKLNIIEDYENVSQNTYLYIDPECMKQVLSALIDNSCKYGVRNGNVWLNVFPLNDKTLRISIKDNGKGIDPEQSENVFKPFNRAGKEFKGIDGTGAGLAIVKGLVNEMKASIDFESRIDEGCTFWIDIPMVVPGS